MERPVQRQLSDSRAIAIAERVISSSNRAQPADAVLRAELQGGRYAPESGSEASHYVFSYYRWRGWLDFREPLPAQILSAASLAQRFAKNPSSFSDDEVVRRCVPEWIHREFEVSPALARSLQTEPRLWLRARAGTGPELARDLGDCAAFGAGALGDTLQYQGSQDLFRTAQFHKGQFEIQDISSQAVGLICDPSPGQTWWDACAGEGGKMLHLSDLMRNQGLIWASDRAEWRLRRLKRRAGRAGVFNYRSALWDGSPKLPVKTRFDGVLIDAPCSGTGTWQRNPHARWTLTPEDLKELSQLQLRLLKHAASALKPGGKLVYSVCSLARSESLEVIEAFSGGTPDLCPLKFRNPLTPQANEDSQLWLYPQDFGGNGMFVACWRRTAEQKSA